MPPSINEVKSKWFTVSPTLEVSNYERPIYGGKKSEVRRCKYNGRDFEKGKKREGEDEPQGGISWPGTIQDTEDEMDMDRYTFEN